MTKIKTAQALGAISGQGNLLPWAHHPNNCESGFSTPVIIVHGLTEAEVHEAAELLAKSREVCKQPELPPDICSGDYFYDLYKCDGMEFLTEIGVRPNFCPSCGRKVVVK